MKIKFLIVFFLSLISHQSISSQISLDQAEMIKFVMGRLDRIFKFHEFTARPPKKISLVHLGRNAALDAMVSEYVLSNHRTINSAYIPITNIKDMSSFSKKHLTEMFE